MKVYTITCHDVYNVGASLQAYALATYLEKEGHQVEIIDYKPDYLSRHYRLTGINNQKFNKPIVRELYLLAKLPGRLRERRSRRKEAFDRFTKEMLPVTSHRYVSNDDLKINLPRADAYIAGSDQIWNCLFQNGRDPAFYLDFAPDDAIKASYAASFATEDVPEEWKLQMKVWLSKLDAISVRESSGVEIINRMGIPGATQVLDPVFLLSREHWEKFAKPIADELPYILLYDFDRNSEMTAAARNLADKNGWKLYSVLPCEECDRCFDQESPQTFLSLVRNAQYVVSNSFHATAFSLIFEKSFAVCRRKEGINTRMQDLLKLVGLEERMVHASCLNVLPCDDFKIDEKKLRTEIEKSKLYINRVLEGKR